MPGYDGYTPARKKANEKYRKEKIEMITIRLPKGQRAYYASAAASFGMSVNQFAITAMNKMIERAEKQNCPGDSD